MVHLDTDLDSTDAQSHGFESWKNYQIMHLKLERWVYISFNFKFST